MVSALHPVVRRPRTRYLRMRRAVYHMLGGEGHIALSVRLVDYSLVTLISVNCLFSILESVEDLAVVHGHIFRAFDQFSVAIFCVEYILRLWTAVETDKPGYRHPLWGRLRYIFTPMAIVDLMAILPFYLDIFFEVDLRSMRVLRLMRVFKLTRYSHAMAILFGVLAQELRTLSALLFVFIITLIFVSSLMYMLEHPYQPTVFSDLPTSMWWAVVTMTTLGYGDMVPITGLGRLLGACTAVIGVGMIALPAGILASGFGEAIRLRRAEYAEAIGKISTQHAGRPLTRRQKKSLEEIRVELGLSQEDAIEILRKATVGPAPVCPHCGKEIPPEGKN